MVDRANNRLAYFDNFCGCSYLILEGQSINKQMKTRTELIK